MVLRLFVYFGDKSGLESITRLNLYSTNITGMNLRIYIILCFICIGTPCISQLPAKRNPAPVTDKVPKIVNIVNFIRLLEPRYPKITEDVLYQTVVKQV